MQQGARKRQIGEWTGDTDAQIEGAAQQIKGKAEKAVGNVKDAAREYETKPSTRSTRPKSNMPQVIATNRYVSQTNLGWVAANPAWPPT